jgi:prepilin-type N-terminal cleavage/methylation domain-containing protein
MRRNSAGFTLIELMIVVIIVGILSAMAIPNYMSMRDRAMEGATKSNMHYFQLAAEDYCAANSGMYPASADSVAARLPRGGGSFRNPFDQSTGPANAFEDRATWAVPLGTSGKAGIVAYGDSAGMRYQIAGHGKLADLPILLSSGR